MDTVKVHFAEMVHHSSQKVTGSISQRSSTKSAETAVLLNEFKNPGWALAKCNTTRFTYWQRKFVLHAFMEEIDKKIYSRESCANDEKSQTHR